MLLQELHHYELLSIFLRLRYSNLTSPAIVYHKVPSIDNRILRICKHDGHPQECQPPFRNWGIDEIVSFPQRLLAGEELGFDRFVRGCVINKVQEYRHDSAHGWLQRKLNEIFHWCCNRLNPQIQYTERQQGFGKTESDGTHRKFITIRTLTIRSKYMGNP